MISTLLYPIDSQSRRAVSMNGIWGFELDPRGTGESEGWQNGLPDPDHIPVPASFQDLYTDGYIRDYCGDFWYEKDVFVPEEWYGRSVSVRFGCATHRATVYANGNEVARHEGGFLPFNADITDVCIFGGMNHISVKINNELNETSLPCGTVSELMDGTRHAAPYFDFFNYSGLQRNVFLQALPLCRIDDYDTSFRICGNDAEISYRVSVTDDRGVYREGDTAKSITVKLYDEDGRPVTEACGNTGTLVVENARLWKVRDACLYTIVITLSEDGRVIDEYTDKIGIRTVEIRGHEILINGEPVYLKGFGKHEDSDIIGRGYDPAVVKRDFELMKWIGANSFRTSHYPYSEEIYQMADREGFLVIDEVQAVGCFPSLANFAEASSGKRSAFFDRETAPELLKNHKASIDEMIRRDKNHPCVIAWSLLNEPETSDDSAAAYFEEVFRYTQELDPQKRPRTFALMMNSRPETCRCHQIADFLSLNRYYGWYVSGGPDISDAEQLFRKEMDAWMEAEPDKPVIFTEFGADTHPAIDKLPSVMWSEGYQIEMLEMCARVFDSYEHVAGEHVWAFSDFQTTEGIMRVDGNKKGVFTRQRQPKRAAFWLRNRWKDPAH